MSEFRIGDIVETVGVERTSNWTRGTLAEVFELDEGRDMINVRWVRTHPDGSDVLDKRGGPLEQRNGGYYSNGFKLTYREMSMEPRKYLKKLTL